MSTGGGWRLLEVTATRPVQAVFEGGGGVKLINRDELNTVYIGSDEGFDPGGMDVLILDPLGSITLDDSSAAWLLSQAGGTTVVQAVPGGSDWSPSPAQIAAQIALKGISVNISGLDWVNITQYPYSADPTGVADATSAVIAALQAAVPLIYWPAGS